MVRWQQAEAHWQHLLCTHACVNPTALDEAQRRRAARERRALMVTGWGDGFGGGSITFSLLNEKQITQRFAPDYRGFDWPVLIFAAYALTKDDLKLLRANAWERMYEVTGLHVAKHGLAAARAAFANDATPPAPRREPATPRERKARRKKSRRAPAKPPASGHEAELARLRARLAFYREQLRQARAFKSMSGAPYEEFTDKHDDNLRKEAELLAAIRNLVRKRT